MIGVSYANVGKWDDALAEYEHALSLVADDPAEAYAAHGLRLGLVDDALAELADGDPSSTVDLELPNELRAGERRQGLRALPLAGSRARCGSTTACGRLRMSFSARA